jgi:hypothetical protein
MGCGEIDIISGSENLNVSVRPQAAIQEIVSKFYVAFSILQLQVAPQLLEPSFWGAGLHLNDFREIQFTVDQLIRTTMMRYSNAK